MAIYLCEFSVLGRAKSGSAVRSASYRAGERLQERGPTLGDALEAASYRSGQDLSDAKGKVYSYRREDVIFTEVMLPAGAHPALADRGTLWREVERVEKRIDAQLARCCTLALPRELDRGAQVELARDFARSAFVDRGMVADIAVHEKPASDGRPNTHAHLMLSLRAIDPATGGFGKKERAWNAKAMLTGWRREWEHACNAALERAQVAERVSCDRLEVQLERALEAGDFETAARVDRLPGFHAGPNAWEMVARGEATDVGRGLAAIREENAERARAYDSVREIAAEAGPEAETRFLEARARVRDPLDAYTSWAEWALGTLERLRELARGVVEPVRELAEAVVGHVRELGDWLAGLADVDDSRLQAARAEVREHEQAHQEREAVERGMDEIVRDAIEEREEVGRERDGRGWEMER